LKRYLAVGLIAACAALAGIGCGDDDKGAKDEGAAAASSTTTTGSTTSGSITKADFVAQADAICATGDADLAQGAQNAFADPNKPTDEEIAKFANDVLVPNLQKQHDDIEALGAPAGVEADVTAMLASLQEGIDAIKSDPKTAVQQDTPAQFKDANAKARAIGLKKCGQG